MSASVSIGKKTVTDPDKLVSDALAASTGMTPKSVSCPSDVEAKVGNVFHCTVVDDAGVSADATVTETSISGDSVHVHISVGAASGTSSTSSTPSGATSSTP